MRRLIIAFLKALIIICLLLALFCDLFELDYIDIDEYPNWTDYGDMTEIQCGIFDSVLHAVENDIDKIYIPKIEETDKHKVLTHLALYYGTTRNVWKSISWGDGYARLDLDLFDDFEKQKTIIDARIDEAILTLYEGTDRFKLWQISNYIANRIEYTDGQHDTIKAMNGEGVCDTYSMIFYKMASRIGIKTFICYGLVGDGFHSWNMVEIDGKLYFYDITFYDKHGLKYIHSKSCWGKTFLLNDLWAESKLR